MLSSDDAHAVIRLTESLTVNIERSCWPSCLLLKLGCVCICHSQLRWITRPS